jgi:hypothetical protein
MIRSAASSISPAVVLAPKPNRKAPSTSDGSSPIAKSTGEGWLDPLAQLEPVEQAT